MAYSNTQLFINGKWRPSQSGRTIAVLNPATEETIGTVAHADRADLDEALEAAAKGFKVWRAVAPFERCRIMRKAAAIMRERNDEIALLLDDGAGQDAGGSQDGSHGRRRRHRVVRRGSQARLWPGNPGARPRHLPDRGQRPVSLVAALHAVEFPDQSGRAENSPRALAAGCSIIVKAPRKRRRRPRS